MPKQAGGAARRPLLRSKGPGLRYPAPIPLAKTATILPMPYLFEWHAAKAAANLRNHGVSFEEATTVFGDPLSLLQADPDHSADEERFLLLGRSRFDRLIIVSFAERGGRTRLISARPASRRERHDYEEEDLR